MVIEDFGMKAILRTDPDLITFNREWSTQDKSRATGL